MSKYVFGGCTLGFVFSSGLNSMTVTDDTVGRNGGMMNVDDEDAELLPSPPVRSLHC